MDMRLFREPSAARTGLLSAGLFLFLLGTNFCLVGQLTGSDAMACMAPRVEHRLPTNLAPENRPAHSESAGGCHGGAESGAKPCCVALAPVVSPQVKVDAPVVEFEQLPIEFVVTDVKPGSTEIAGDWLDRTQLPPPTAHFSAPQSPRAPPLD